MKLYLITFAFSTVASFVLINSIGLMGAVITYLAEMCLLLVLVTLQFANVSVNARRRPRRIEGPSSRFWG